MTLEGTLPLKILLRNTQTMLGDRLMFTPAVRDLKLNRPHWQIGVVSAGPEIWANNPHVDPAVTEAAADHVFDIGPGDVTRGSKTNGLHIAQAFFTSLEKQLFGRALIDTPFDKRGPIRPDLHLSDAEKSRRLVDGHYWVINIDTGPMSAKRWPPEYFQQVIDAQPALTFVQIGLAANNDYRLKGPNVIDMLDRTQIRDLFSLVYHAAGCVSLVSSLAHVAAAFCKPCVTIAGGREPDTFERYPFHRYLDSVGTLPCCREYACWHNALSACEDHDGTHARCMRLIEPRRAIEAIDSYYIGGALELAPIPEPARRRKILRIVANAKCLGGAERSVAEIARMFVEKGWNVEFTTPTDSPSPDVLAALPDSVRLTNHVSRPCDVLLLYASDMVFGFDQPRFEAFERLSAGRKVMALTYKHGKVGQVEWTRGWDRYLFLSTAMRDAFNERRGTRDDGRDTAVLAPAVDLDPFLAVEPDYHGQPIRIARHSSQGDKKYPPDLADIIRATPAVEYHFRPAPQDWLTYPDQCTFSEYDGHPKAVAEFLGKSNCFWYLLPDGYTDQGPRVIVEAMAAGLAVIAENRDGAADRVTPETGWLLESHSEAAPLINTLTADELERKGKAARARAIAEFDRRKWYHAITGD